MLTTILQETKDFWKRIQAQDIDGYHDMYDHGNNGFSETTTSIDTNINESIDNTCESDSNSDNNDSCSDSDSDTSGSND